MYQYAENEPIENCPDLPEEAQTLIEKLKLLVEANSESDKPFIVHILQDLVMAHEIPFETIIQCVPEAREHVLEIQAEWESATEGGEEKFAQKSKAKPEALYDPVYEQVLRFDHKKNAYVRDWQENWPKLSGKDLVGDYDKVAKDTEIPVEIALDRLDSGEYELFAEGCFDGSEEELKAKAKKGDAVSAKKLEGAIKKRQSEERSKKEEKEEEFAENDLIEAIDVTETQEEYENLLTKQKKIEAMLSPKSPYRIHAGIDYDPSEDMFLQRMKKNLDLEKKAFQKKISNLILQGMDKATLLEYFPELKTLYGWRTWLFHETMKGTNMAELRPAGQSQTPPAPKPQSSVSPIPEKKEEMAESVVHNGVSYKPTEDPQIFIAESGEKLFRKEKREPVEKYEHDESDPSGHKLKKMAEEPESEESEPEEAEEGKEIPEHMEQINVMLSGLPEEKLDAVVAFLQSLIDEEKGEPEMSDFKSVKNPKSPVGSTRKFDDNSPASFSEKRPRYSVLFSEISRRVEELEKNQSTFAKKEKRDSELNLLQEEIDKKLAGASNFSELKKEIVQEFSETGLVGAKRTLERVVKFGFKRDPKPLTEDLSSPAGSEVPKEIEKYRGNPVHFAEAQKFMNQFSSSKNKNGMSLQRWVDNGMAATFSEFRTGRTVTI